MLELLNRLRRRSSTPLPDAPSNGGARTRLVLTDPLAVLAVHKRKLTALRLESGYSESQFRTYIREPLLRVANYVHQLPASRAENHREQGGLFRFALETAFLSFRRADGKLFTGPLHAGVSSRQVDLAWRYSAFIAGLCVPLGRAASGVLVQSSNGKHTWNPYANTLVGWAKERGLTDYELDWRNRQDARRPGLASGWIASRVVHEDALKRLHVEESDIMESFLEVVTGRGDTALSQLVTESIHSVIDQDLAASRNSDHMPTTGVRIEHRVLDAMRGLIRDKWTINTAGSRVWVTEHGVFLNWKPAVNDIVVRLKADGIKDIPTEPDTVAELLLEVSVLTENPHPTTLAHYHKIVVHAAHIPKAPMECVQLANAPMLGLQLDTVSPLKSERVGWPAEPPATEALPPAPQAELVLEQPSGAGDIGADLERLSAADEIPLCDVESEHLEDDGRPMPDEQDAGPEQVLSPNLSRYGEAGLVLEALCKAPEPVFVPMGEGIAIPYPGAVADHCEHPKDFLTLCQAQSLLVGEGGNPRRVVRKRRKSDHADLPSQYIVFVPRLAKALGLADVAS